MAADSATAMVGAFSAASVPTWRAAYSDRTAAVMARFCELAYVADALPTEGAPSKTAVAAPSEQARPALEVSLGEVGFRLAQVFEHAGTRAYLAVSDQFAVLAFRGTANLADWGIDVDALRADLTLPDGRGTVSVHEGFLGAFMGCAEAIKAAVDGEVPAGLGLYITGHSLGGALAQIASAWLERDTLAACYTFGSPRVGTLDFDTVVKCPHYRLVDHFDVVPTVPPPFWRGYLHSGDPRLIRQGQPAALRRDRSLPAAVATNAIGLAGLVVTHKAVVVDDHMIGRYRAVLEAIAASRQTPAGAQAQARAKSLPKEVWGAVAVGVGLAAGWWLSRRRG